MFYNSIKPIMLLITVLLIVSACNKKQNVDAIYYNAQVNTVDSEMTKSSAFAISDDKFVEVGSDSLILAKYDSKSISNLEKAIIFPGLWDAHCHFYGYGLLQSQYVNLVGTTSMADVIDKIIEFRKLNPTEEWILGRGWDQNDWDIKEFPNNAKLDSLFPNTPVLLTRIDGHAVLVNSKTIEVSGFNENTIILGGDLLMNNGKLSGVMLDNAADILKDLVPRVSDKLVKKSLLKAQEDCFAVGITSLTDAGLSNRIIHSIDSLQKTGELKMRINAMLSPSKENFDEFVAKGIYKTDRLLVNSMKLYSDGALGSRGACLLEPYSDNETIRGFLLQPVSYYDSICNILYNAGYQANTHAIGDSAVRMVLNTYKNILKGKNDKRWRIEHAQTVNPNDFHFFGDYNIIPAVNTTHATSDMYWAEERLGAERIKFAYAYKLLLEQNQWCTNGSDFPIEHINPLFGFYAGVARQDQKAYPKDGFQMENAWTREQALKAMTIWAAKGCHLENESGSIEAGKNADFVILDRDIMIVENADIFSTKVELTVVNGEVVYKNK